MDSAMRDLERMRERDEGGDGTGRRIALLGLAGVTTVGVILALCLQVGSGSADDSSAESDPLARLDRASGLAPSEPVARTIDDTSAPPSAPQEVDAVGLTFPETLQHEARPEVAAALAAASAELRHPDPLPAGVPTLAAPIVPVTAEEISGRLPAALPAAIAAGTGGSLARATSHDAMLQHALPARSGEHTLLGDSAPEGHDGEYTVQVISYDSPEGAHAFAAGLRVRGHRAFVMRADVEDRGTVYRVRVGPFETNAQAQSYRRQFEETERMNVIVVRRR